jgi:hypothetical protein
LRNLLERTKVRSFDFTTPNKKMAGPAQRLRHK